MEALNVLLAGAGPWGALIGVALTLAVNYLRTKQVLPSVPATPAPAPTPAPTPTPSPVPAPAPTPILPGIEGRPLLNLALQILPLLLAKKAAPVTQYGARTDPLDLLEDHAVKQLASAVDPTK